MRIEIVVNRFRTRHQAREACEEQRDRGARRAPPRMANHRDRARSTGTENAWRKDH
jgi:hypothetical protein